MTIEEVNAILLDLAEEKNAKHSSSLTPNAKPMLGVRIPNLRKLAKQIAKEDYQRFLEECPDDTFEQQCLQAFVLGYAKDDIGCILGYADKFVPKIQDWAVNDGFCQTFTIARAHREIVWEWLQPYAHMQAEFAQRVPAVLALSHFLVEEYIQEVFQLMNQLNYDGYYTKMAVAWCLATAYAKFPQETQQYLQQQELDRWTYKKAIQKMLESYRITPEQKNVLRMMRGGDCE